MKQIIDTEYTISSPESTVGEHLIVSSDEDCVIIKHVVDGHEASIYLDISQVGPLAECLNRIVGDYNCECEECNGCSMK